MKGKLRVSAQLSKTVRVGIAFKWSLTITALNVRKTEY